MSEDSQKTEEPTPRRLRKAKEQGDSGASTYAAQGVAFLVAVSLAPFAIGALGARTTQDLRQAIARSAGVAVAANAGKSLARMPTVAIATELVALLLPMLAAVALGGTIAHVAQTGGFIAGKRLTPNFSRINPVAGAKNLFSLVRAFAVARALIAGSLSGWLAYDGLRSHIADVAHVTGRPRLAGVVIAKVAGGLAWKIGLLGVLLGALDIVVTRTTWRRRLRMSKDEVRREHKDAEGDPQLKAARERAHGEMLAQATLANVRNATVVVVNPTHLACALLYDENGGNDAPVVIATGTGEFAARIVRAAHDHVVPVLRNVPLARALADLHVGEVIPEALYEAVAEILREVATTA